MMQLRFVRIRGITFDMFHLIKLVNPSVELTVTLESNRINVTIIVDEGEIRGNSDCLLYLKYLLNLAFSFISFLSSLL